jgi:hypothetical protein
MSAAAQYVQCVFFPTDVLAGEYDIATRAPEAVKLIEDAEDELARGRRSRGTSSVHPGGGALGHSRHLAQCAARSPHGQCFAL